MVMMISKKVVAHHEREDFTYFDIRVHPPQFAKDFSSKKVAGSSPGSVEYKAYPRCI